MLYKELKKIIEENNNHYATLNFRIAQLEEHLQDEQKESSVKLQRLLHQRWQFIHDYATQISDLLITKTTEFTRVDLSMLDLIPYNVWGKMTGKSKIIVQVLKERKND